MKRQSSLQRRAAFAAGGLALAGLAWWGGQQAGWWSAGATGQGHVALILKTEKNPFFRKISEAAQAEAQSLGLKLDISYGTADGDSDTQLKAIERAQQNRVGAILITPSDGSKLNEALARARQTGILVLMIDSPVADAQAFDSFIGTDNFEAGRLVGQYIAKQNIAQPKVALLNLFPGHPVGVARRNGFLNGLGHADITATSAGTPGAPEVVCEQDSFGDDTKGGMGMADCMAKHPEINIVYAINEPAAAGAFRVVKASNRRGQVQIVSIDGGCPGVEAVKRNELSATSQQFPALMASRGMQAAAHFMRTGEKPARLIDTGVKLVAATDAQSVDAGLKACW
jgi:fructose transport system substrate-binding protein